MKGTKKRFTLCVITLCLLITGCGYVSDRQELISYAEKVYGAAECIDYTSNPEKTVVIMRDAEYGFDYSVESEIEDIVVDGSLFGHTESRKTDFYEKYVDYLQLSKNNIFDDIKSRYMCQILWTEYPSADSILITLKLTSDFELAPLYEIAEIINEYDTRNAFHNMMIEVYYDTDRIGVYYFDTKEYLDHDTATRNWFLERAYKIMHDQMQVDIRSVDELTFLYKEILPVEELKKKTEFELVYRITDTEESLNNTAVYHFSYKGEEWIIADCLTYPDMNLLVFKVV